MPTADDSNKPNIANKPMGVCSQPKTPIVASTASVGGVMMMRLFRLPNTAHKTKNANTKDAIFK